VLVGFARHCLQDTPSVYDTDVIRQRHTEAALAALDALWAMMAEHNDVEGEPTPLPGLIMFNEEVVRLRQVALPAS
jgi:hypothetical protein